MEPLVVVVVLLVLQQLAAVRGEDGTLTVRVNYTRVALPTRVAPRTFRTLDEVRGGWKQQVLHLHAHALQQGGWEERQKEEEKEEEDTEKLRQLQRQKQWEKQSGHSFGEGEVSNAFDIASSEWWHVLENAAAGGDTTEEGEGIGSSRLVVVMLAPAWNADALALAREMEAMSARNATSVPMAALSGTSEVSFVWVSDDQSASEARQRMCSRRMMGKGDSSSGSGSRGGDNGGGGSKADDEGIMRVILDKIIGGDTQQQEQQHEQQHEQTSIDTRTNANIGDVALEEFMHLPLPVIVVLERSGSRAPPQLSKVVAEASSMSRFSCYLYNGSWRAWPIVHTAAKLSSEISRRDEALSWRDDILIARPRSVRDMDELRLAYDFVAVAYVNCGACRKMYSRTRAANPVSSDVNKLKEDMKTCLKQCRSLRNAFREVSIFMCPSPTIRFAIIDLALAAKSDKKEYGDVADTPYDGGGGASTSAASDGAKTRNAGELKRLYYHKRASFNAAGEAIAGADDRYGDDVLTAERDDMEFFSLNLLSRHGQPFSYVLDDKVPSNGLAKELIVWLTSRMTHDMDIVDKDGVSVNTVTMFGDVLNTSVRGAFDVERLGARGPALSHPPQRLKSKVNIIFFIDKFAPLTHRVSGHDTASAVRSMRKLAFDFYNNRDEVCPPHATVSVATSMNRTQTAYGSEKDVYFSMMHSSSPPLKGSYAHWIGIRSLPAIGGVVYEHDDDTDEDGDSDASDAGISSEYVHPSNGVHFADGATYIGDAKYYALQPVVDASLGHASLSHHSDNESEDRSSDIGLLLDAEIRRFVCGVVDGSADEQVHRKPEFEDASFTRDIRDLTASSFEKLVSDTRAQRHMTMASPDASAAISTVTLVLLHAPYCGFCSRARALFSHLERNKGSSSSRLLPRDVEVHFASVDCSMENCREMLAPAVIEEYPKVLLVTDDGAEPFVYEGSLHGAQLMRFVREVVSG